MGLDIVSLSITDCTFINNVEDNYDHITSFASETNIKCVSITSITGTVDNAITLGGSSVTCLLHYIRIFT